MVLGVLAMTVLGVVIHQSGRATTWPALVSHVETAFKAELPGAMSIPLPQWNVPNIPAGMEQATRALGELALAAAPELGPLLDLVSPSASLRALDAPAGFPENFEAAKRLLETKIYHDVNVELYCGCTFDKRKNIASTCPLETTVHTERAGRVEWEHVTAASSFGHQLECWRNPPPGVSGRQHCGEVDAAYRQMEADPHNLIPVNGALNAIRSNYRFGMVPRGTEDPRISGCDFKLSGTGDRFVEPPDNVKGRVARAHFYMEHRYGHRIGGSQRRLFEAWDRQFPVTDAERIINQRLAREIGVSNPFVERRV